MHSQCGENAMSHEADRIAPVAPAVKIGAMIALLALPLAGCMSQGGSSFAQTLDLRGQPASVRAANRQETMAEPLPLNVAQTQDAPIDASAAPIAAQARPGVPQQMASHPAEPAGPRDIAALAPADNSAYRPAELQLASIAPSAPIGNGQRIDPLAPSADAPVDPEEEAADLRATELYANMKHGQCKGGWGPKPLMLNAERINPQHSYYMEMRLRHTPPLPVGHVYIAYGRMSPEGEPLDEKMVMLAPVGGYAGATVAAAAPVTGVLEPYGDDCILRPIASYRVSLSAQQYEKLLLRIRQAQQDKPKYALWTYNCNHFMSDVAASVGILPPKNRYKSSLTYFYEMMDRNEGRKVPRSRNDPVYTASTKPQTR